MVLMGFAMSLFLLGFSLVGVALPVAPVYPLQEDYVNIFGPVWRLLFASMAAYLLAQMVDVQLFHFWKRVTRGKHLWLRNNGSTMISQLVDSLTVNFVFLYGNPTVFTGTFWDLMGIVFNNHPDPRRILLPDDWEGHPLRKDYPVQGPDREPYQGRVE